MKTASLKSNQHLAPTLKPRKMERLARGLVLKQMGRINSGQLVLEEEGSRWEFGTPGEINALVTVTNPAFWTDLAFGGSIGAGESWMHGHWQTDDLVELVRLLLRNRHALEGMESGWAKLTSPLQKAFHWINRNTREGARRNISAHYDLGNEFFALWLDSSMMYSCAIFENDGMSLREAQLHRLDEVCRALDLGPDDHLVEIGTGWGSMAIHAARNFGCQVTTTTISRQQFHWARQAVRDAGLENRVNVLFEDYRDLEGNFDKLVSLEMIEAIGWKQYDTYFEKCGQLLKPGGRMLIQAITIANRRYKKARTSVDFIQRYIFPGSNLPSSQAMTEAIANRSQMEVTGIRDIGLHYATTLNHWRQRFLARLDDVRNMGYPDEFIRMWEYYLCYCEGAFLERAISDIHLLAEQPRYR